MLFILMLISLIPVKVIEALRSIDLFDAVLAFFKVCHCIQTSLFVGHEHILCNGCQLSVRSIQELAGIPFFLVIPDPIANACLDYILAGIRIPLHHHKGCLERMVCQGHRSASIGRGRRIGNSYKHRVNGKDILRGRGLDNEISTPRKFRRP